MTTTGELKFKLALEDEGINWDQAEKILGLVEHHLLSEHIEKVNKARDILNEVNLTAYSARHTVERWDNGLLEDLKALSKPLPDGEDETVEELQAALAEVISTFRYDAEEVVTELEEIEDLTK